MPNEAKDTEERSCKTCKHFYNPFCLIQAGSKCYDAGYTKYAHGAFSIYKEPEHA